MSHFKGFGTMPNGSMWNGPYGFLYKKYAGGGGRRNPSYGLICNRPTDIFNKYQPGGGGVGASSVATRRAKNRRATICQGNTCFPCYMTLGQYSSYTHNPNGYVNCIIPPTPIPILPWLVYALNRGPGAGIRNTNFGWDANGVWFSGSSSEEFPLPAYPVFTNFTIPTSCSVTVTVDFVYNKECADFGMCLYLDGTVPEWEWGSNETRIACQYDCEVPYIYGQNEQVSEVNDILIIGNTYTAQMIYDPNNTPNVTFNTLLNGTILETLTLDEVLPSGDYRIGFTADQDTSGFKTYMKNLTITIDCEGTTVYTNPLQNIRIQQQYLTLYSKNNITSDGFPVGGEIDKDMDNLIYTGEGEFAFNPQDYYPEFFPDMAPFTDENIVAGDKDPGDRLIASKWSDWGDDVFDDWGYFYLYDVASGKYYFPLINPQNEDDGVLTTQTFNAFGRTFTINQGYPVEGIFKFDISVNDNAPFRFGAYGNMGSDGDEVIDFLTYQYTMSSTNLTLYYMKHQEDGDNTEILYSYFIPKQISQNSAVTYVYNRDGDVDSIISNEVTNGLIVYFSKKNDVKEWVVNDLGIA